jgi:hypothetical protein
MLNCFAHCEMCEGGGSGIFLGEGSNPAPPGYSYCFRTYECQEQNGYTICIDLYETCYPLLRGFGIYKEKGPPAFTPVAFVTSCLPTLDNLRNFFLTPTAEMLSFLQTVREAP